MSYATNCDEWSYDKWDITEDETREGIAVGWLNERGRLVAADEDEMREIQAEERYGVTRTEATR